MTVLAQVIDITTILPEVLKQGGLFAALCFLIWLTLRGNQKREDELKAIIEKNTDALDRGAAAISANAIATNANTEATRELKNSVVTQTLALRYSNDHEGPTRNRR